MKMYVAVAVGFHCIRSQLPGQPNVEEYSFELFEYLICNMTSLPSAVLCSIKYRR